MSKKRSTENTPPPGGEEAQPAIPPKIVDLLGEAFEEPRLEPPPKTIFAGVLAEGETPGGPTETVSHSKETAALKTRGQVPPTQEARTELPQPATPATSERALPAPMVQASVRRRMAWIASSACVLLLAAGIFSIARFFLERRDRPIAGRKPTLELHEKKLTAPRLKPRFSIPPAPSPESVATSLWGDPAIYGALGRLDLALDAGTKEGDVPAYLRKAGLALFDPRFGVKNEELASLDASLRKIVSAYRDFFVRIGQWSGASPSSGELANAAERFAELVMEARGLETKRVLLCRNVTGFGRYEPVVEESIRSRHLPLVQVYVEFAGAKPEIREDGRYIYRLSQGLRLRRANRAEEPALIDTTISLTELSLSPRRDFFSAQYLRTEKPAPPGDYVVEIELTDQVSGARAFGKALAKVVAD